jgi:hypothetical protein
MDYLINKKGANIMTKIKLYFVDGTTSIVIRNETFRDYMNYIGKVGWTVYNDFMISSNHITHAEEVK